MKQYFCTVVYRPAGTKKMEQMLGDIARTEFLHHLVPEERLQTVAGRMSFHQENILHFNKRLQAVDIKLWPVDTRFDNGEHRTITCGQVHIQFQQVKGEYL